MAAKTRVRFTVGLERSTNARLMALARSKRPNLTKQFLIELAVERLLDDAASNQLELPLSAGRR